jgi:hypothetical protein
VILEPVLLDTGPMVAVASASKWKINGVSSFFQKINGVKINGVSSFFQGLEPAPVTLGPVWNIQEFAAR